MRRFARFFKLLMVLMSFQLLYGSDWLIDPTPFKACVIVKSEENRIVLTNDLIERVFVLRPNLATISFKNLTTEEEFVRAVEPEAELMLDSLQLSVGGLTGQPVLNYLNPQWLKDMRPTPYSFKLVDWQIGPTKERFHYQPRKEWLSQPVQWPPEGKRLSFRFKADDDLLHQLLDDQALDEAGREILFEENFATLNDRWQIHASRADDRNSFVNEGKFGEIMARAHQAVFAERPWPAEGKIIVVGLNPGTDQSMGWGPGITLIFNNQRIKFYLRPAEKRFCAYDGQNETYRAEGYQPAKTVFLKLIFLKDKIDCQFSYDQHKWQRAALISRNNSALPLRFRIGKTDWSGDASDYAQPGPRGRCRVESVKIYGKRKITDQSQLGALDFLRKLEIFVHYEIYDGIPLLAKWLEIKNGSDKALRLNRFTSEMLAVVEAESPVGQPPFWRLPNMTVETDYAFGGGMHSTSCFNKSVFWNADEQYSTQVNYQKKTPCLLQCRPQIGPDQILQPGQTFESFWTFELLHNSWDRERKGLAQRKMYRLLAPWTQENPILMHVRSAEEQAVKMAIDQCAEVGFEMVILTFGSGFNIEDESPTNLQKMKRLADYAHQKGIAIGGYSLLASRSIGPDQDVQMPPGQKPKFGHSPCLQSEWGRDYFRKLYQFFNETHFDVLEHDGSYPGDVCASTKHPGHRGLLDSQWAQFTEIRDFYRWCRARGIYLNVPDWYFLNGSNKTGMGYRETNWSLPRAYQEIIERQNIFDGTWEKTPSMGWMFVPLVQYHGGGEAATIEPLREHLDHYQQRLINLFTAGVQACYRGPRLYDAPETRELVKRWVDFYKKYRAILDADVIHLRRPDGRDWDGLLHVDPQGAFKGLLVIHNPTNRLLKKKLSIPFYYTGLKKQAEFIDWQGNHKIFKLQNHDRVSLQVELNPKSVSWWLIK